MNKELEALKRCKKIIEKALKNIEISKEKTKTDLLYSLGYVNQDINKLNYKINTKKRC